jgi:hypothetical protein
MHFIVNSKKILFSISTAFLIFLTVELIYLNEKIINTNLDTPLLILTRSNSKSDKLNEFKENHEMIIKQSLSKNQSLKIVFNGLSERVSYGKMLYSFLTSLLIAILTDSALLLKWKHMDKYIEEPLYQTFNQFDHVMNELNIEFNKKDIYYFKIKSNSSLSHNEHMNDLRDTMIPNNYSRIYYESSEAYYFEICSNPIYYDKLLSFDLVRNGTVLQALKLVQNMDLSPSITNDEVRINRILQIGFEVSGNLLNKFWLPKQNIQNLIDFYLETKFRSHYVIGIQLSQDSMINSDKFIQCALDLEKREVQEMMTVKWFVSSDSPIILEKLLNQYGKDKIIVANGTIGHVELDSNSYERAILDNELLSKCNELIISFPSSFGIIASIIMQKMPFFINQKFNNCTRMSLSTFINRI